MKRTCTKSFEIDYGHRVLGHTGKCNNHHGHRGKIEVTAELDDFDTQNDIGMLVDFGVIKSHLGEWVDDHWDHAFIVYEKDEATLDFLKQEKTKHFIIDCNPTAENLAAFLLSLCPAMFNDIEGLTITSIKFWETPTCNATASVD